MPWATGELREIGAERLAIGIEGTALPDPAAIDERVLQSGPAIQAAFLEDTMMFWERGAQVGLAALTNHVGMPDAQLFANIARAIKTPVHKLIKVQFDGPLPSGTLEQVSDNPLVTEIAEDIVNVGFQVAGQVSQVIPIIGWVIGLGIKLGRTISDVVAASRAGNLPKLYPPAAFNPGTDLATYRNFILGPLRGFGSEPPYKGGLDWTLMFEPPADPDGFVGLNAPFHRIEEEDWSVTLAGNVPLGGGMIPGSVNLHSAIDVLRGTGSGSLIRDTGEFLPTAQKQAAWIWQGYVMSNTPAMFTVDATRLASLWHRYLERLRQYLNGDFQNNPLERIEFDRKKSCKNALGSGRCDGRMGRIFSKSDRTKVINFYADRGWFGWATETRGRRIPTGIKKLAQYDPYRIRGSTPVKAARLLRERQFKALDTLTVAYIDEGYAAINSDAELREKWKKRRGQLLSHPDRCHVELDSVPWSLDGGVYIEQLRNAGVGGPGCMEARLTAGQQMPILDVPPNPEGLGGPTTGSKKAAGIGVAAAAAAALMLLKR